MYCMWSALTIVLSLPSFSFRFLCECFPAPLSKSTSLYTELKSSISIHEPEFSPLTPVKENICTSFSWKDKDAYLENLDFKKGTNMEPYELAKTEADPETVQAAQLIHRERNYGRGQVQHRWLLDCSSGTSCLPPDQAGSDTSPLLSVACPCNS